VSLFRRCTGIVLQFAVLVMPLVGSGARCDDDSHASHMSMSGMSMPGMPDMADMPDMPGMQMPGGESDEAPLPDPDCTLPWSGGRCDSMASCAPGAMTVERPAIVAAVATGHDEPAGPTYGLRSVTRTPETTPPRA
jgi:hypothetical protein